MNEPNSIEFPLFSATQNEKGEWIYKSKPIEPKKKDGRLKKRYKDLPRVKAIYEVEAAFSESYKKEVLDSSMKEINDKLIEFSRARG